MPTNTPKKPVSYLRDKNKIELSGESDDIRKRIRFDLRMYWFYRFVVLALPLGFKDELKLFLKWFLAIISAICFVALVDFSLLLSG